MEEKQSALTEEQHIARLFAEQAASYAAQPVKSTPPEGTTGMAVSGHRPRARKKSPYRQAALLVAGLFCYALLISLAALAWGSYVYMRQGDVAEAATMPLVIFFGAVFLASYLVTALSRGGTIFPALALAVAVNLISLLFAQTQSPQIKDILLKLLLTLTVAVAGFVISKLLYMRGRSKQNRKEKAA